MLDFSDYLLLRRFPNPFRYFWAGDQQKKIIAVYKEIFDYIIANLNNINDIVTDEMLAQFQQQYQEYLEDAQKYGDETIEQKRDRLNQRLVANGQRAIRFPK